MNIVRIIHADDHSMVTNAIRNILEKEVPHFQVVAFVKSYPELFDALNKYPVDLLLLDGVICGGDLKDNLPMIRAYYPNLKVLLLWLGVNEQSLLSWIHLLNGQISLASNKEELIYAIEEIVKGNNYYSLPVFHRDKKKFGYS